VEQQNIPPILAAYGSREFGDRGSAISIGSWIFPEFLTKRPQGFGQQSQSVRSALDGIRTSGILASL
jgi:hypothetical protein